MRSGLHMKYYLYTVILFLLLASVSDAKDEDPSLQFLVSGKLINEISLSDMKSALKRHKIEFFDPLYGKQKRYEGFSLGDVLRLGFGDKWGNPGYTDIAFAALDGYHAVSDISKAKEAGGYIVFRDRDEERWEPIGKRNANPAPFYLVWTGKEQTSENEYPWPWQLASVNLMSFRDAYPMVYPEGADKGSNAYEGYLIFKGRCVRCHSMNRQGGNIGPDLNAPRSIVTYRSPQMIKEFIKNPSKYRYTFMPDHPDFSEEDLDNILSYLTYMNEIKR